VKVQKKTEERGNATPHRGGVVCLRDNLQVERVDLNSFERVEVNALHLQAAGHFAPD